MKNLTLIFSIFLSVFITACGGGSEEAVTLGGRDEIIITNTPVATDTPVAIQNSISVSWDIPTKKVNGDPLSLSEIAGFKIYIATNSAVTPHLPYATIADSAVTAYSINNLPAGTYYIYITTFDVNGDESPYSDYITKTV